MRLIFKSLGQYAFLTWSVPFVAISISWICLFGEYCPFTWSNNILWCIQKHTLQLLKPIQWSDKSSQTKGTDQVISKWFLNHFIKLSKLWTGINSKYLLVHHLSLFTLYFKLEGKLISNHLVNTLFWLGLCPSLRYA